jgi:hypothetical protein
MPVKPTISLGRRRRRAGRNALAALTVMVAVASLMSWAATPAWAGRRHVVKFTLLDPVTIGALNYEVYYGAANGHFVGDKRLVECESLLATPIEAGFHNDGIGKTLKNAVFSMTGFRGPVDLARCTFETKDGWELEPAHFRVSVKLISAVTRERIEPFPRIAVSEIGPAINPTEDMLSVSTRPDAAASSL